MHQMKGVLQLLKDKYQITSTEITGYDAITGNAKDDDDGMVSSILSTNSRKRRVPFAHGPKGAAKTMLYQTKKVDAFSNGSSGKMMSIACRRGNSSKKYEI